MMQQSRMTGLMNEMSISVPESKESLLRAHFCAIVVDTAENGTEPGSEASRAGGLSEYERMTAGRAW